MEAFANQAVSTLSAAITTATAASCSVVDATAFPATGNFRIKIDDELLIVTAVAGNTFTIIRGVEGTTAATHGSGANVIHLLTKGSLEARVANRFISDIYDNKPSAGVKGRLFLPTDGLFLEYDDGSAWHKYGPYKRLKAPPQTGWIWVNQGNATATHTGSTLILEDPDLDATNPQLRVYVRYPSKWPVTITMAYTFNGIVSNVSYMGFCFREIGGDSDGYITTFGSEQPTDQFSQRSCRYSSPTVKLTDNFTNYKFWPRQIIWWRLEILGNKQRISSSADGVNFLRVVEIQNDPDQFGIFIDPTNNSQKVSMSLVHWEES
jgi:hypothetical protein